MDAVLVTGGAGYVGSHCCKVLAANGYIPVTYDNLSRGDERAVQWGPLERGDIGDRGKLEAVLGKYTPVAVMHFAAYAYVGESLADPALYYRNNVGGSLALLEAMRSKDVNNLVFSSSCTTFGIPDKLPIDEDCPQRPINPYGASKFMVERIIKDFGGAYGTEYAILRYFNACGCDPDGDIGEEHDPETHLIPRALMAVLGEVDALDVFGCDYPTADGTCVRDYIHVMDLAEFHLRALRHLMENRPSFEVNLGTGRGCSVTEVLDAVRTVTGIEVPIRKVARREGDPAILVADPRKSIELLKFKANYHDVEAIVETAWRWHSRNFEIKNKA